MNGDLAALETSGLGKRYGIAWGLQDCSFALPKGRVAALVGPNGSGKSTLLRMAAGITRPSAGWVQVFGHSPQHQSVEALKRVGYLDQERPVHLTFRVSEMLRMGRSLNPNWDDAAAHRYLDELDIPLSKRLGKLSVGQQAQVALAVCLAKRPELLLLDEPVAALDPLARSQLMQLLMRSVVDDGTTVLLSAHALADLESVCDYVIILSASRVQVADDLDRLLAGHRLLVGARDAAPSLPEGVGLVASAHTERQISLLVRVDPSGLELLRRDPSWEILEPTLEEVVVAYLREQSTISTMWPRRGAERTQPIQAPSSSSPTIDESDGGPR
jgi:ABC-2 type transport system ATP-binding protein